MGKEFKEKWDTFKTNWNNNSSEAWGNAWKSENIGSSVSSIAGGVGGILQAGMDNAQIKDTSAEHSAINDVASTQFNYGDYDSLMSSYNPFGFAKTDYTSEDVRGASGWELASNTIGAIGSGASAGASVGGPWGALVGGIVGAGSAIGGLVAGNIKASEEAARLNEEARIANETYLANYSNNASNISQNMFNNAALNIAAFGGDLDTYDRSKVLVKNHKMKHRKSKYKGFGNYFAYGGQMMSGNWSNGVVEINEGNTHEKNPLGGVLMGLDSQGVPNLVEEGEVIFNDYVFSNRLKITAKQVEEMHLDPKLEGLPFSEAAKKIQEESSIRPLDNISKNTLVDGLSKLTVAQEETRMKKERQRVMRAIKNMDPQELSMLQGMPMETMQSEMPTTPEEAINPMQEPQFADSTPRAYKTIQEEMPEQYAFGGQMANYFDGPGSKSNFLETFGDISKFKYWNAANNSYNQDYLNWLNTYDIQQSPKWKQLSDYYKSVKGTELTPEIARTLGKDKKYGNFHVLLGDAYDTYKNTQPQTVSNPQPSVVPQPSGTTEPRKVYILRKKDANGMTTETPIFTDGYNEQSADWNKYDYTDQSTTDGVTNIYFKEREAQKEIPPYPKYGIANMLPGIMSGLSALGHSFQEPDYSNTDLISRGRRGIRNVSSNPIGNYLSFNPYDINYQQNKMQNMNLGTQRNVLNSSSGNRGTALADMLAYDLTASNKAGELYRSALEYNDQQRMKVGEFNRDTNKFNATQSLESQRANQQADTSRAQFYLQEAEARDKLETAISEANNTNRDTFYGNMGALTDTMYNNAVQKWLYDMGVLPGETKKAKGGRIARRKRRKC